MRLHALRRLVPAWGLLLLVAHVSTAWDGGAPSLPKPAGNGGVVPDISRYFDTWLWVKSEGTVAVSDPTTRGAARTLILNPDLTYEFHQRHDTRDSVLCQGRFLFSEEAGVDADTTDFLDFEGWFESYERRMSAEFFGPDTLDLAGEGCDNCPEHTFVRGRTTSFDGSVHRGERFQRDLWDGLRMALEPTEEGWEIVVRDTTRPEENLARLTPPLHFANPRDIDGWHFRNQANAGPNQGNVNAPQRARDFIFSRRVGRSIQPAGTEREVTEADIERVGQEGRGVLIIEDLVLTPPARGEKAGIESMRFSAAIEEVRPRGARAP